MMKTKLLSIILIMLPLTGWSRSDIEAENNGATIYYHINDNDELEVINLVDCIFGEQLTINNPYGDVISDGNTYTFNASWGSGVKTGLLNADWGGYDYVWVKYSDFEEGLLFLNIEYSEFNNDAGYSQQRVTLQAPSGIVGIPIEKNKTYEHGDENGNYIGKRWDAHVRSIGIQCASSPAKITIEDVWVGTRHQYNIARGEEQNINCYSGSIVIPSKVNGMEVTSIGNNAFSGCTGLTSVTIPSSVTSIGENAFSGCTGLTSVVIPATVTSIGDDAYNGCTNLTSVKVWNNNPVPIGPNTFTNRANATLIVPKGSKAAYEVADYWKDFEIVEFEKNITFADPIVKDICVENWDADKDGELSYNEAATVSALGETFSGNTSIQSFKELKYFTGLTSLGNWNGGFHGCSGLTSVAIPNSVTSIEWGVFYGCTSLAEITVEEGNPVYDSRDNCNAIIYTESNELILGCKNTVIPNTVTSIGSQAFEDCTGLTEIDIPNTVTSIGDNAFVGCTGLTEVHIPNSVTCIRGGTFSGCTSLTEIVIPEGVTSLDSYSWEGPGAFSGCTSLMSVSLPSTLTDIGTCSFSDCSSLSEIIIPESVTNIGWLAFSGCSSSLSEITVKEGNSVFDSRDNCNAIILTESNELILGCKNTVIPNSVTSIGGGAFSGCSGLTSITIPNSVTSIGGEAFSGCSSLTEVAIPNSVTSIGYYAFDGCSGLTEITIPNTVTHIEWGAFQNCSGLTAVTIPNSVTNIENEAFYGCSSLTSVKVGKNILPISSETFSNRSNATLYVPRGSKAAYEAAPYWGEFKSIIEYDLDGASIRISSAGVATYCSDTDLDFTNVKGLKAYVATGYNTRTHDISMMRVNRVPAGTGLYLKGNEGTYDVPYGSSYVYLVNLLKGTTAPITLTKTEGNMSNFILSNGESGVGFYPLSQDGPFGANKAYLQVPSEESQGAKMIGLEFEEDVTNDISEVNADQNDNDSYYTLTGVKVKHPTKGIYIHKGKKVVIE